MENSVAFLKKKTFLLLQKGQGYTTYSKKSFNRLLRLGWRSLRNALASI